MVDYIQSAVAVFCVCVSTGILIGIDRYAAHDGDKDNPKLFLVMYFIFVVIGIIAAFVNYKSEKKAKKNGYKGKADKEEHDAP